MPLAKDLMGVGMAPEEAIREGDVIQYVVPSTGTNIGGPTGATIIELASGTSGAILTFLNTTEIDRTYWLYNTGTAVSVNVPVSAGTGVTSSFQSTGSTFTLISTKSAFVTRLGVVGTVNTTTDRWIYLQSN